MGQIEGRIKIMKRKITIVFVFIALIIKGQEWKIVDETDGQIFPSAVISMAHITEDKLKELMPIDTNDNEIGNTNGWVFLIIKTIEPNSKIKIELNKTNFFDQSVIEFILPKSNYEYNVYPEVIWDYEKLLNINQPTTANFTIKITINGKELGQKNRIMSIRSINECLYGQIDPETNKFIDLSYLFAAYVNENNPLIDEILKEALDTKIINSFNGYQDDNTNVNSQIFSIWYVLQKRGFKYSSITKTSQTSKLVYSQRVRAFENSLYTSQANCVDGTVLFASILRAIGIEPILIMVPGHMFLGYYVDKEHTTYSCLETTMMGNVNLEDYPTLESQLNISRQSFDEAEDLALKRVQEDLTKFYDDNQDYKMIEISDSLRLLIQPIGK